MPARRPCARAPRTRVLPLPAPAGLLGARKEAATHSPTGSQTGSSSSGGAGGSRRSSADLSQHGDAGQDSPQGSVQGGGEAGQMQGQGRGPRAPCVLGAACSKGAAHAVLLRAACSKGAAHAALRACPAARAGSSKSSSQGSRDDGGGKSRGHESKISGQSLDLKDTGLSASDQSGDLEGRADLAETAEMDF